MAYSQARGGMASLFGNRYGMGDLTERLWQAICYDTGTTFIRFTNLA